MADFPCRWELATDGRFDTACGEEVSLSEMHSIRAPFRFCPFCGGAIDRDGDDD